MSINSPGSHVDLPLVVTSSPESTPRPSSPKFPGTTTTTTVSITGSGAHLGDPFFVDSSPEGTPQRSTTTTTTTTVSFAAPGSRQRPLFVTSSPPRASSSASRTVPSTRRAREQAAPTAPRHLRIYGDPPSQGRIRGVGPPSMIPQDVPRRRHRDIPGRAIPQPVGPSDWLPAADRERQALRRERYLARDAERSTQWAADVVRRRALEGDSANNARPAGVRPRRPNALRIRQGFRSPRVFALTEQDLYLSGERPETLSAEERPHHKCGICLHVKAHPVLCSCGHSFCYVCVRMALEYTWICPLCRGLMTHEPVQDWDSANAVRFDFPNRRDNSMVTYSWDGLVFPQP
ncbi:hypothetical protein DFH06DRAFT_1318726 [Mycena polygramma]|nr:hypothetical protein DFH06DRAFT_1314364 [Mycena polygramma]KAJ7983276.1 hypothetical protein DFH06DRAFT_1318726 [Mycena polygramma]